MSVDKPALADILAQQVRNAGSWPAPRVRASIVPQIPPIAKTIIDSIPDSMYSEDRVRYLADQVNALLEVDRAALREFMKIFVRFCNDVKASDMDTGGEGCDGYFWYRVDGDKKRYEELGQYTPEETDLLFLNLLNERQMKSLFEEFSADFSFQLDGETADDPARRFRTTCYFDNDHLGLNMRAISDKIFPMKTLGFHPLIEKGLMFRHVRDGLTLVTGVTGSGKSTTLDAIIDANNEDVAAHIIVIAKPIEYMHKPKRSIVRNREVGKDVRSFKEGIVQALRQDPDMIVIGEMRDPQTISAALEITDSGHKVFSTLHTISAVETLDRIIAEYPTEEQERVRYRLADVLRCIISQKLCPKIGGGRILAKEIMWLDASARAAIKNGNTGEIYQMMWEGTAQGMVTLEQDLINLTRRGLITPETAVDFANNKRRLQQLLR